MKNRVFYPLIWHKMRYPGVFPQDANIANGHFVSPYVQETYFEKMASRRGVIFVNLNCNYLSFVVKTVYIYDISAPFAPKFWMLYLNKNENKVVYFWRLGGRKQFNNWLP